MFDRRCWLWLAILLLALPASGNAARVQVPSAWRVCTADADCELFHAECGYCSGGDVDFDAYNKKWAAELERLRHTICWADYAPLPPDDDEHVHVRVCTRNIGVKGRPKCVENACRLVVTVKP